MQGVMVLHVDYSLPVRFLVHSVTQQPFPMRERCSSRRGPSPDPSPISREQSFTKKKTKTKRNHTSHHYSDVTIRVVEVKERFDVDAVSMDF